MPHRLPLASLLFLTLLPAAARPDDLQTVAEKSDYRATSRYEDVVTYCKQLAKESPIVRLSEMGRTVEGRVIPLVIVADPPVQRPEEVGNRLVVLTIGNIHAGEVDGKEALLMLARDLVKAKERPLLKDLVLVFAPIFNADGNEKISTDNRRSQNGPADGVGIRANAASLDLNRDFVKLESPEVRALVGAFRDWSPAVFIDCHTTNGSYHRYTITYEGPRSPAGDPRIVTYTRDELLPDVTKRLEKRSGYLSFFYGNFNADRSQWQTVPATPRYGIHYFGLRGGVAVLSESYSYASFKDRVLGSRDFVLSILDHVAQNTVRVRTLVSDARGRSGAEPKPDEKVVLRHKSVPGPRPVNILGFEEELKDGRRRPTEKKKTYEAFYTGHPEPTLTVDRPHAYLFPASFRPAEEALLRHGIAIEELREEVELDVETYRIDAVMKSPTFQKHQPVEVTTTARKHKARWPVGTRLVKTTQPLGSLACFLLEPMSEDGLTTWNFFDETLKVGQDFPVVRLRSTPSVRTVPVRLQP